jgi:hypothetical protein
MLLFMKQTFEIDGSTYTEEELIDILREQLPGLKKYSQYVNGTIEFCRQNKDGNLFFSVTPDDINEEEMFIKIGQDGNIYWDWIGQILDD